MTRLDCQQTRRDFNNSLLRLNELSPDPITQFILWYKEAVVAGNPEPNAMVLSTVDIDNIPDSRVVLLKEVDDVGFVFFTHYESTKARQIEHNPQVALNFYWPELSRQVRIRGNVQRISPERSAHYFATRSHESQSAVYAFVQSTKLAEEEMEKAMEKTEQRFQHAASIPCPENWGGYCVEPFSLEFFNGRQGRLHDRILYTKTTSKSWLKERLAP